MTGAAPLPGRQGQGPVWAGRRALEALEQEGSYQVLTVHSRGFWAATPRGVVGLLRLPAPRAQRLIGLDPGLPLPAAMSPETTVLTRSGSRLVWTAAGGNRVVLDISLVPLWDPPPLEPPDQAPAGLPQRAAHARRVLALLASRDLDVPAQAVAALAAAARAADLPALAAAVSALAGRGGGLTPSGDDVLAGFAALCRPYLRDALRPLLAGAATTRLSKDLLMDACDGHLFEPAAALARWLLGQEPHPVAALMGRLLRIGHLSGLGLATGLLAAADLLVEGRTGLGR